MVSYQLGSFLLISEDSMKKVTNLNSIDARVDYILKLVPLGIDVEDAFLLAECTEDEIDFLRDDETFASRLKISAIREEKRLLSLHSKAIFIQAGKGNTTGIQWKLEKTNKKKWGNGDDGGSSQNTLNINLNGLLSAKALEDEDGVEINGESKGDYEKEIIE
jgi:hypothetical protein